jgi:hypothetical protein
LESMAAAERQIGRRKAYLVLLDEYGVGEIVGSIDRPKE